MVTNKVDKDTMRKGERVDDTRRSRKVKKIDKSVRRGPRILKEEEAGVGWGIDLGIGSS